MNKGGLGGRVLQAHMSHNSITHLHGLVCVNNQAIFTLMFLYVTVSTLNPIAEIIARRKEEMVVSDGIPGT